MSNYTPSTDFSSKDALLPGNPSKVIKGTEISAEFSALQTAVNTKYDSATVVPVTAGGTGVTTLTGVVKGNGTGAMTAAVAGTDYLAPAAIGVTVQGYDAATAKTNADQSWTGSQRATPTTDNDGSFDLNAAMDFLCTPTAGFTLTFTNIVQGQRGCVYLVNGANYAIAAAGTTKVTSSLLSTISATGEYWLSYWSPDGTNVLVTGAGDFA